MNINNKSLKKRLDDNLLLVVCSKTFQTTYDKPVEGRITTLRKTKPKKLDYFCLNLYFKNLEVYNKHYYDFNDKDIIITYNIKEDSSIEWLMFSNFCDSRTFKYADRLDDKFDASKYENYKFSDFKNNEEYDYVFHNKNEIIGSITLFYKSMKELDKETIDFLELEKYIK